MLGRVFDLDALNALPPAQASDTDRLVEWHEAATATHELVLNYGPKPGPKPDRAAIGRNMAEYQDQYAAGINFLIRLNAREVVSTKMLMASLRPEERTRAVEEAFTAKRAVRRRRADQGKRIHSLDGSELSSSCGVASALADGSDLLMVR